jgi:hypothetical protein
MIGCHHCLDCSELTNKSYCINNQQLSKEEYQQKKAELLKQKSTFPYIKQKVFFQMGNLNAEHSTGTGIINSDNIENGYIVINTHNARNVAVISGGNGYISQNMYDCVICSDSVDMYASLDSGRSEQVYCCIWCGNGSSHCFYSINLANCSFCLGCMGLQNKQFCIFNQQYTKEERHAKVDEIFQQMEKD